MPPTTHTQAPRSCSKESKPLGGGREVTQGESKVTSSDVSSVHEVVKGINETKKRLNTKRRFPICACDHGRAHLLPQGTRMALRLASRRHFAAHKTPRGGGGAALAQVQCGSCSCWPVQLPPKRKAEGKLVGGHRIQA